MLKKTSKTAHNEIRWGRFWLVTAFMASIILIASICTINHINNEEQESCIERLYEEGDDLATSIERAVYNDLQQLRLIASMVSEYDSLQDRKLWTQLDAYEGSGLISRLELLLPDNSLLVHGGRKIDVTGKLSFEKEARHGLHISEREEDLLIADSYILRQYAPVVKQGKIIALLCGVVIVKDLPLLLNVKPYAGKGELFVIDAKTGDFLVDTWHPGKVGNIISLGNRDSAPGYEEKDLQQEVLEGKRDYIVITSKTTQEYAYLFYRPIEVKAWRIVVAVPEDVVFENYYIIKNLLRNFLIVEFLCFALYLIWLGHMVLTVTSEKQRRLDLIEHIHKMEVLLFNAHVKEENMTLALKQLCKTLKADLAALCVLDIEGYDKRYLFELDKTTNLGSVKSLESVFNELYQWFLQGQACYMVFNREILKKNFSKIPKSISSLIAVPIKDVADDKTIGILLLGNLEKDAIQQALLKALTFSFALFCSNLKNRLILKEEGERDALTGVYNRNRFENDLPGLLGRFKKALTCVYFDVNGLREMNNFHGHAKGDKMLRTVAMEIQAHFNTPYIYRIGGDEFVLFVPEGSESSMLELIKKLSHALKVYGYHVAVGIKEGHDIVSLAELIKDAEKNMYVDKNNYYEVNQRFVRENAL